MLSPFFFEEFHPRSVLRPFYWDDDINRTYGGYTNPRPDWIQGDFSSQISYDDDKYEVNLDVQHFTPKEISVKLSGQDLSIEAKHKEKKDKYGDVSRHFIRRYIIPEQYDLKKIRCTLSKDGVLSVIIGRKNISKNEIKVKVEQINEEQKAKLRSKL